MIVRNKLLWDLTAVRKALWGKKKKRLVALISAKLLVIQHMKKFILEDRLLWALRKILRADINVK